MVNGIYQTHCVLQENAAKAINYNQTVRNWLIGCYIIEYKQNGDDKAKYGTGLLEEIAKKLNGDCGAFIFLPISESYGFGFAKDKNFHYICQRLLLVSSQLDRYQ